MLHAPIFCNHAHSAIAKVPCVDSNRAVASLFELGAVEAYTSGCEAATVTVCSAGKNWPSFSKRRSRNISRCTHQRFLLLIWFLLGKRIKPPW